jgi:hypothetical protein
MKLYYFIPVIFVFILVGTFLASAQIYEVDYNKTLSGPSANLVVQVLKYDPFPVNAGDWFDLWIKVQNVGQTEARNVKFQLQPEYPFSSDDNDRSFGTIYGTLNAYKVDQTYDSSEVILKFRVKVADNAPVGTSNIKLNMISDSSLGNNGVATSLPITIGKTKTDFDVVWQSSSAQGSSFAISNTGSNAATAVTVKMIPPQGLRVSGADSSIIGNINAGDFTTVTFSLSAPNMTARTGNGGNSSRENYSSSNQASGGNNVVIEISYTDSAGIRTTIDKNVTVNPSSLTSSSFGSRTTAVSSASSSSKYLYVLIGIILGVIGVLVYQRVKKKK